MYADDEPIQLGDSYYPLEIVQGSAIMNDANVAEGTDQILEDLGYVPAVYDDEITWRMPTSEEATKLHIGPGVPVVRLAGRIVRLEPLGYSHAADLLEAAAHEEIWTYLDEPTPRTEADMLAFIGDALADQEKGTRLDIRPADRTLEIGWTWLTPAAWGTGVNTECKYLLMSHAFESWQAGRVAVKTDARNMRSRKAIENLVP
jgi:N-acetyltransferase